jgi:putative membrane-bound dehydrogenase-like protein
MSLPRCALVFVLSLLILPHANAAESLGFTVPDGFEVSLYADDALASDIYNLTIDAKGRVVVAGRGYVKILEDTKGAGKADKATLFSDVPKSGARGMYFDGDDLICTGDAGVLRISPQGDGTPAKVTTLFKIGTNGEHSANGIVRGPDGWYYLICGNNAGVGPQHCQGSGSLIKKPNSGALLRFSPDGKTTEVIADGFRNPFDLDFDRFGRVFTVDSDGERIYRLPWYTPCRLFDIAPGMHHGWLLPGWGRSWARPAYFPDNVERLVEIGRGSPTGVLVYRHHAFPEKYRDGVFNLCWTFGRLYFFPLKPKGASYEAKMEVFLQSKGDEGFAPVDMAVGPEGDLFIAIGGRGTRGGVYRVHYKGQLPKREAAKDAVREVLQAPQPLSSWSRAKWVPAAKKIGKEAFVKAVRDDKLPVEERMRSVEVLVEVCGGVDVNELDDLLRSTQDPNVKARIAWCASRAKMTTGIIDTLVRECSSADPRIGRSLWEAIANAPEDALNGVQGLRLREGLEHPDRRVRWATQVAARGPGQRNYRPFYRKIEFYDKKNTTGLRFADRWIRPEEYGVEKDAPLLKYCLRVVSRDRDLDESREAVRLLQIIFGDIELAKGPGSGKHDLYEGYAARRPDKLTPELRKEASAQLTRALPSTDRLLDLELTRTLGMFDADVPGLLETIAAHWTAKSRFDDDVHYLIVFSRLPTIRTSAVTKQTARAISGLIVKLAADGARPGDQMPAFLEELWDALVKRDPALPAALVADPSFGVPGHELFGARMPKEQQAIAARKLLAAIKKLDEDRASIAWSSELVKLVTSLPDVEALPVLREQAAEPRLADSIALILAKKRQPEDRARLVEALGSSQEKVVASAAEALLAIAPEKATALELGAAIKSLRRFGAAAKDSSPRAPLVALLDRWSGQKFADNAKPDAAYAAAFAWYNKSYPKEAAMLAGMAGADAEAWKKRFDKLDWAGGDIKRGERVFQGKCARCHGAIGRLGPDLSGVGQRFSRDDLFTAILDPSKDILPAFQPTRIVTKAGKTYNGLLIYQSAEATLLQTTPDTTVRIGKDELLLAEPGKISFMPTGLLDDTKDADLSDLYAYLKSLRKQ